MNQLQIRDYVKSFDGNFTQVYGFGHLDHERDETFLQIKKTTSKKSDGEVCKSLLVS